MMKLLAPIFSFFKSNIFSVNIAENKLNLINFVLNFDRREIFLFYEWLLACSVLYVRKEKINNKKKAR